MSKAEGVLIMNSQNAVAAIGAGEAARRKLADISNLPQKGRPLTVDIKSQSIPETVKEYIEKLQKENMALAKMLAHRNKIVEQSGIELEKLRFHYIKMREQNQQLALSHTQMLAELNSGKDRLKALQHELGCRNGLLQLQARSSRLEANMIEEDESPKEGIDHEKPRKPKRKLRSLSVGSSEQLQSDDNAGNRLPLRRQSARFKAAKSHSDDVSEKDDAKFPKCPLPDGTVPSTSVNASVINEDRIIRPVRGQSARSKAVTPKQGDDLSEIDGAKVPTCPCPDETVQENASTLVDVSVRNEGHARNRPSVRRQSARFTAVRPKQADDLFEVEEAKIPKCQSQVPDNDSTVKNEAHVVQRPSIRRQSAKFNAKRPKQVDDVLEINDAISIERSSPDKPVPENVDTSGKKGDDSSCSSQRSESQVARKPSLGRPSRLAAQKVNSYKEIPLNVKMRRHE